MKMFKLSLLMVCVLAWPVAAATPDSVGNNDKLASGYDATCIIEGTTLYCWGPNAMGAVGDGTTTARSNANQYQHSGSWKSVSSNWGHTCAINSSDELYCWGKNDNGQLGQGDLTDRSSPTRVGTATYYRVANGSQHTCAIRKSPNANTDGNGNSDMYCFGDNAYGQVGDGTTTDRTTPTLASVKSVFVAAGWGHTCIITATSGTTRILSCVGQNNYGQLGDNTTTNNSAWQAPRKSDGTAITMNYVSKLAANTYQTCVIGGLTSTNSELRCWGNNSQSAVGDPSASFVKYVPTSAKCMPSAAHFGRTSIGWNICSGFTEVSVGYQHVVSIWDATWTQQNPFYAYHEGLHVVGMGWGAFDQFAQYGSGSGFNSTSNLVVFDEPDGSCYNDNCSGVAGYTGYALGVAGGWYRSFGYYAVHAFREYGTDTSYPSPPWLQSVIDAQGWEY